MTLGNVREKRCFGRGASDALGIHGFGVGATFGPILSRPS
jgi:hypothetical protein